MNLEIISEDASFLRACRDIARETSATAWNFTLRGDWSGSADADLCLWEYKPVDKLPRDAPWGTRCFVLVAAHDLASFRATCGYAEPGIILKPVSRAVLRAVLTQRLSKSSIEATRERDLLRSDRDELLQCLLEANLQLQEFESQRSDFLGRALHDFHAPLSALSGYCGLLLEEQTGSLSDHQKLIVTRMHRSVRRLSRMSRAMFQLSVGRHVSVKPQLRDKDIRECVEQALHEVWQLVDEKQLQLDVQVDAPSTPVLIDSGQIEQVFINLLENACKFSPRGGSIAVRGYSCFCERRANNVFCAPDAERRGNEVRPHNAYRVDIIDSGPGVSPEHMKSIFEEYVSYAGTQVKSRGGLGLAICRLIIQQHQGRIWAETRPTGATFSFILSIQTADMEREASGSGCERLEGKSVTVCA